MRLITPKIVAAVAAVAALAAGGAALTAGNTVPTSTAGYGSASVSGANVESIHYDLDSVGEKIQRVDLVFTDDVSHKNIEVGFGGHPLTTCQPKPFPGVKAGTTDVSCTVDQGTAEPLQFHVAVHD
jgi:hypothetical protein